VDLCPNNACEVKIHSDLGVDSEPKFQAMCNLAGIVDKESLDDKLFA
jgi:hypothetical protein